MTSLNDISVESSVMSKWVESSG